MLTVAWSLPALELALCAPSRLLYCCGPSHLRFEKTSTPGGISVWWSGGRREVIKVGQPRCSMAALQNRTGGLHEHLAHSNVRAGASQSISAVQKAGEYSGNCVYIRDSSQLAAHSCRHGGGGISAAAAGSGGVSWAGRAGQLLCDRPLAPNINLNTWNLVAHHH